MEFRPKPNELGAAAPVRRIESPQTTPDQRPADVVVIYGPDCDPHLIEQIDRQCATGGLAPMVVGNGRNNISMGDLMTLRRAGKLGPNTHAFVAMHGDRHIGEKHHVVLSPHQKMTTTDFISSLREPAEDLETWTGVLHLLSCKDGAVAQDIDPQSELWKMGPCVLYTGTDDAPMNLPEHDLAESIRFIAEGVKDARPPSAMQVFAHLANTTGDTVSLIGGELEQPLTVGGPKSEHDLLPGALEAEWRKVQTHEKLNSRLVGAPKNVEQLVTIASSDKTGPSIETRRFKTLFTQCRTGDANEVAAILKAQPELLHARDQAGNTLLHGACFGGNLGVVELLVSLGMDVNAVNELGEAPMHDAARGGKAALIQLLVGAGARVDAPMSQGATPLQYAVRSNKLQAVVALMAAGADPNAEDDLDNTPARIAMFFGLTQIEEVLRTRRTDPRTTARL